MVVVVVVAGGVIGWKLFNHYAHISYIYDSSIYLQNHTHRTSRQPLWQDAKQKKNHRILNTNTHTHMNGKVPEIHLMKFFFSPPELDCYI